VVDHVLFWMADQGRMGKKASAGFYAYSDKGERRGPLGGAGARLCRSDKMQPELTDVQHRLLIAQVLEAVRALEDGVLTDIREGDVGAILGWGFAPWSGGPFSWLDIIGADPARSRFADGLTARFGPRFHATRTPARHGGQGADVLRPLRGSQGRSLIRDSAQLKDRALPSPLEGEG
jgi:3-hydroxyacyl-CoA dehydrogenase / enoyl-CoA hydratase / 3-hydroxybutyryl-CoA epimerase